MIVLFVWVIATRIPLEMSIERSRGALHRITPQGLVENSYNIQVMNMSQQDRSYTLSVDGLDGLNMIAPESIDVRSGGEVAFTVRLMIEPDALTAPNNDVFFTARAIDDDQISTETESRFFGPADF
jgi:polyferredoxin